MYPSFREASGLLHVVAILAALYDDELKAVLIDEPELSLHPQYQAFVRREIERVAGDPTAGRKIVIYATHAPAMVRLRSVADLPDVAFFSDAETPPTQVDQSAGELQNRKLSAFARSLGAGHREALFATRPLVVEGPSDEIVLDALNAASGTNLHAAGGHILPATGKGSMPTILKLLRLTGKEPAALAHLDAFTDDLGLVQACNDVAEGRAMALSRGHANLYDAAKPVHDQLAALATTRWGEIEAIATKHSYWRAGDVADDARRKRRAVAAALLQADEAAVRDLPSGAEQWLPLRQRLTAVLSLLEAAGLFILRHGTIEDSYAAPADHADKIATAWAESDAVAADPASARVRHATALRALQHVSRAKPIDESAAVAEAFLAVVAPALDELRRNPDATPADLAVASRHARDVAGLFRIIRAGDDSAPSLEVHLAAPGLDVSGFPLVVKADENVNAVAQTAIRPSLRVAHRELRRARSP
ncbi:hypothetical protein tb265_04130 [Gemmatimonadetes bacterium T265]|nr:hypothetical protein tb265_04130 [Gemmatimonadetes bacterium T265]